MSEQINLGDAREDFFTKEGGVGKEAGYQEAQDWLIKALGSLNYPAENERAAAIKFGCESVKMKFLGQKSQNFRETPLSRAEDFLQDEQERLESGGQAPWL